MYVLGQYHREFLLRHIIFSQSLTRVTFVPFVKCGKMCTTTFPFFPQFKIGGLQIRLFSDWWANQTEMLRLSRYVLYFPWRLSSIGTIGNSELDTLPDPIFLFLSNLPC